MDEIKEEESVIIKVDDNGDHEPPSTNINVCLDAESGVMGLLLHDNHQSSDENCLQLEITTSSSSSKLSDEVLQLGPASSVDRNDGLSDTDCTSDMDTVNMSAASPDCSPLMTSESISADDGKLQADIATISTDKPVNITAVTLADGTTALVHSDIESINIGGHKILKAQTIQLEDGTTAYIPAGSLERLKLSNKQSPNGSSIYENDENTQLRVTIDHDDDANDSSSVHHSTIELDDGSTAVLRSSSKDNIENLRLSDRIAAFITADVTNDDTPELFTAANDITENDDVNQGLKLRMVTTVSSMTSEPNFTVTTLSSFPVSRTSVSSGGELLKIDAGRRDDKTATESTFVCQVEGCGKFYSSKHHLKVHARAHTGDRPFKCKVENCGKAFTTGYGLKSHIRVHTGEKPYKCIDEKCAKAFKTSGDLQKHIRTHTGERPFKCLIENCNRSFTTSNIRKVHMRVHTGERPYVCTEEKCGKSFASATNFKNHMRIHTGEKPYACDYPDCYRRFTEYSSLYKHHVVHTMSKPYTCELCGKTYRQTSTLGTHKRSYHGVVETILQVDHNGDPTGQLQVITGSKDARKHFLLDETDRLLADGNVIITKPTIEVDGDVTDRIDVTTLQADECQAVEQSLEQIHEFTVDKDGNVVHMGKDSSNTHQQIYVLADPSQLAILQEQISNGQLITTLPIDAGIESPTLIQTSMNTLETEVESSCKTDEVTVADAIGVTIAADSDMLNVNQTIDDELNDSDEIS